ncbi:MAG TPA: tungstate ABC transporter permease WtpB [Methanobacterium sp.]|nr:tungstate ABC transporter permease WtpB [Methanobacterium sp.]
MRNIDYSTIFFALMGSFIILFIFIPLATMILSENPSAIIANLQDSAVLNSIFISAYCALIATIIALLFGVPLAYVLARHDFYGKGFIESIIDIPIVIPHTVTGIALLTVFSSTGIFGLPLSKLGIVFIDALPGIVIAMLFVSSSFVVNAAREGFENVDPRMEKVARTLGSGSFRTFFVITLPLALRSIVVGSIMTWARAISEFGSVIVLAYYPMIAPTLIYQRFLNFGLSSSKPVAVILISVCLILFITVRLLLKGWKTYDKD